MNSSIVDGKVLDWKYKKTSQEFITNFFIGDIFIGQIFKMGNIWSCVSFHTTNATTSALCPMNGFKTRYHAAVCLLKLCGYN